jgi:hypothetical protein
MGAPTDGVWRGAADIRKSGIFVFVDVVIGFVVVDRAVCL